MAINEIAGSVSSTTLGVAQQTGAQRATQQTLEASTQTNNQSGGATSAGSSVTGGAQATGAGGDGSSSGDPSRGGKLDITV